MEDRSLLDFGVWRLTLVIADDIVLDDYDAEDERFLLSSKLVLTKSVTNN